MKAENINVEERAIRYIAKAADGSMRDALSLIDQCIAFYLGQDLKYENVLEVLGAVDTAVFENMLCTYNVVRCCRMHAAYRTAYNAGQGTWSVCK